MERHLPLLLILFVSCGDGSLREADDALRAGNNAYHAGRYANARDRYEQALHDPRVQHNAAKASYRIMEWDSALERATGAKALFEDPGHRSDALHDLGNTRVMQAAWADSVARSIDAQLAASGAAPDDIAGRVKLAVVRDSLRKEKTRMLHLSDSALVQGVVAYKQALRLDPQDEDSRYNFAYAAQLVAAREKERREQQDQEKNDQELSEKAKQLIARADELVEEYRFKEAHDLLQQGLQEDPSLAREKQYIDKLEVVTRAAEAT
jgi:tetratricopeptide (TPR) repeat protein